MTPRIPHTEQSASSVSARDTTVSGVKVWAVETLLTWYQVNVPYIPADFECETLRPQVSRAVNMIRYHFLMRAQVEFPNCWNGKDVYTPDQSHVAYGAGDRQTGPCPSGFRRIPTLLLESEYQPREHLCEIIDGVASLTHQLRTIPNSQWVTSTNGIRVVLSCELFNIVVYTAHQ